MTTSKLTTRLVVRNAADALTFYSTVLGATEVAKFVDGTGTIVHAELQLGDGMLALAEEDGVHNFSPEHLDGSAVILMLLVPDADGVANSMVDAGSTVLIPIDDRPYGRRDGRLRDPFGHLWIITQDVEDLDCDEIDQRIKGTSSSTQ